MIFQHLFIRDQVIMFRYNFPLIIIPSPFSTACFPLNFVTTLTRSVTIGQIFRLRFVYSRFVFYLALGWDL